MNKLAYWSIYIMVKAIAVLPFSILYLLSDLLYLLVYKVIGYRKNVVAANLRNSFPEKTSDELKEIERKFYHHFCDYLVESFKLFHISDEEIMKRAKINNKELLFDLVEKNPGPVLMYIGHYGNWEWFTASSLFFGDKLASYQIYRKIKSKPIDQLFINLRESFGALGIEKNDTLRAMIRLKKEKIRSQVAFLTDQTPSKANIHYWTTFLNQDSAVLTGAEKIAEKLDLAVVYADVRKVKRGYYEADLQLITANAKGAPEFSITEEYIRRMEKTILRDPAYWLWSHKRWKHKRES